MDKKDVFLYMHAADGATHSAVDSIRGYFMRWQRQAIMGISCAGNGQLFKGNRHGENLT